MDGYLYAVGGGDNLYQIGNNFEEEWRFEINAEASSQIAGMISHGALYVGSEDGKFYSIDMDGGRERWSFDHDGVVRSTPAVGNRTVYAGTDTGQLYALIEEQ